jgi:hypothetical protein
MNFYKAFLVLGLFLAYTCSSFASAPLENELDISSFLRSNRVVDNKIYLQPGTVYIAPDQILLNVEGQLLPIGNLSADSEGVFVTTEGLMAARRNNETWTCRRCGRTNSIEDRWCRTCNRDPHGNLHP